MCEVYRSVEIGSVSVIGVHVGEGGCVCVRCTGVWRLGV